MERTGYPHLRDDGSTADETVVAFSVSLEIARRHFPRVKDMLIARRHFPRVKDMLEHNRLAMTSKLEEWYSQWRKPQDERRAVGAV
jgi:hypothetical protein